MKFKTIFVIFNIVLTLTFLFIFLLPLFVLGFEPALRFWGQWWYLGLVFLGLLGALDYLYLANAKVYSFMEREDIAGLAAYLEEFLFEKKKITALRVRLFLQASLREGHVEQIRRLGEMLRKEKPVLARKFALNLSLPLFSDFAALRTYALEWASQVPVSDRLWLKFAAAFAYLNEKDVKGAQDLLLPCALESKDPLLRLLALYYLMETVVPLEPSLEPRLTPLIRDLKKGYTATAWEKHLNGAYGRILILVVLNKVIESAREWLDSRPA